MPKKAGVDQSALQIRGRDVATGKVITMAKTQPLQMSLFQTFLPDDKQYAEYSNTIELYDAVPKYYSRSRRMNEMRKDGIYLPTLEHNFEHNNKWYTVEITPARLKDRNGNEMEYYPAQREELVEESLKKLACEGRDGVFLDDEAGVQFKLYELYQELKRHGHTMNYPDLITALNVCHGAGLTVRARGTWEVYLKSHIFPMLILGKQQEWDSDSKDTYCYVQFNPLVTRSINKLTYRQFHYQAFMSLRNQLSRYLFKRLSHNYTQASWDNPYNILLSTIVRDSALVNYSRTRDQVRYVDTALDELTGGEEQKKPYVLMHYEKSVRRGLRNKIEDVLYTLIPSYEFTAQMKKANKRDQYIKEKALQHGLSSPRAGQVEK